jgi:hypothetical protein
MSILKARDSLIDYITWLDDDKNILKLDVEQDYIIRDIIKWWNYAQSNMDFINDKTIEELEELHDSINHKSGNEPLWIKYLYNITTMRLDFYDHQL